MANEPQPLSVMDMETISDAVLELVAQYPDLPFKATSTNILWQSVAEGESIGLLTMQGAYYLSKYVSGTYTALFPFQIIYKCNPTNNQGRINKQNLVAELSAWLETCTATFTDPRITLEKIERTSPVYKKEADGSGYEQYTCSMNLKYQFKKG